MFSPESVLTARNKWWYAENKKKTRDDDDDDDGDVICSSVTEKLSIHEIPDIVLT